jgi:hypothetical protein
MTGCHHGVVTRLKQAAEFPVLRIWCVPHQIDIVMKNAIALPQDGQWIEVVYKWCVHLRRQEKLIMDMNGEMCPKKTKPMGSSRQYTQVLHLASTQDCRTHRCPCALRVTIG